MNHIRLLRIIALAILYMFSAVTLADTATKPMKYHYWDLGASQKRDAYQFAVLKLALDKTLATDGEYELNQIKEKYSAMRTLREVSKGETINIAALPYPSTPISADDPNPKIIVNKSLLRGMLGYRKLVVRRQDLQKFERINTDEELKQLIVGQGRDWEDIGIYKYNGYKVLDSADFFNLFAMLAAGRFDYIPLGAFEVDNVMSQFPKYSREFAVVPNIIIYYPFPVVFHVSINEPLLAKRVEKGLAIMEVDGSLNQLFEEYFHDESEKLKSGNPKVFVLRNPNIPDTLGLRSPELLTNKSQ